MKYEELRCQACGAEQSKKRHGDTYFCKYSEVLCRSGCFIKLSKLCGYFAWRLDFTYMEVELCCFGERKKT